VDRKVRIVVLVCLFMVAAIVAGVMVVHDQEAGSAHPVHQTERKTTTTGYVGGLGGPKIGYLELRIGDDGKVDGSYTLIRISDLGAPTYVEPTQVQGELTGGNLRLGPVDGDFFSARFGEHELTIEDSFKNSPHDEVWTAVSVRQSGDQQTLHQKVAEAAEQYAKSLCGGTDCE
jgi:hypothetical protein